MNRARVERRRRGTWTTAEAADQLGVSHQIITQMACHWYPAAGSGGRYEVTATDLKVARAWLHLECARCVVAARRAIGIAAERAIRADAAAAWLLVADLTVTTHPTTAAATVAWLDSPAPVARLIRIDGGTSPCE